MYKIYALFFQDIKRIYVGMTKNIEQRIKNHKMGKVRSTKNRGEFFVKILEECKNREEARKREKYWKSGCGKEKLKIQRGGAMAARVAHNHEVPGSSPGPATNWGRSSVG